MKNQTAKAGKAALLARTLLCLALVGLFCGCAAIGSRSGTSWSQRAAQEQQAQDASARPEGGWDE